MTEPIPGPLRSLTCPPPLPPRNSKPPMVIGRVPPPLPPRRQTSIAAPVQTRVSSNNSLPVLGAPALLRRSVSIPVHIAPTDDAKAESSPNNSEVTPSAPVVVTASVTTTQTTSPQNGPTLPSVLLSLVLKEPVERSHGRISTITAVQSLFASTVPAPPPFDYSTLVDHALLASQIALHDPQSRQQKRLPLVLSLSIGAFLVAATGIIPRYLGWAMLAGATWFGPGRYFMKELWYVSAASVVLSMLVDIFPMLTLGTLLWVGVIAASRVMEVDNKPVMGKQNTVQLVHSTATALQSGKDFVQNVSEWWAFRQSEPQKQRRAEKKIAKKEAKLEKLQTLETQKESKQAEMGHQEAEKLRQIEEQKELKRKQLELKEAEKARKKEIERAEAERLNVEKQRILDEEARLKKAKSEEKQRLRQRENELKQLKAEEKVTKKRKELEEKETREREKLESKKQAKKPDKGTEQSLPISSETLTLIKVEPEEPIPLVVASAIDLPVTPSTSVEGGSCGNSPDSLSEVNIPVSLEVTTSAGGDLQ